MGIPARIFATLFVSPDTDEIADFTGTYWKQTIWWDGVAYDENQA